MKTHKVKTDEHRKKLFSEHGHKSLKKYEHESLEKAEPKGKAKVSKVMHEYKEKKLHSGSKKGPIVTNPKQAIAISLNSADLSKSKKHKK
jgi:hypothetical protein